MTVQRDLQNNMKRQVAGPPELRPSNVQAAFDELRDELRRTQALQPFLFYNIVQY